MRDDAIGMILDSAARVNKERRKFARIELEGRVEMQVDGRVIEADLVNISLNGAFVTSTALIEIGSSIIITVYDGTNTRTLSGIKARVVRITGNGMGLQFD